MRFATYLSVWGAQSSFPSVTRRTSIVSPSYISPGELGRLMAKIVGVMARRTGYIRVAAEST